MSENVRTWLSWLVKALVASIILALGAWVVAWGIGAIGKSGPVHTVELVRAGDSDGDVVIANNLDGVELWRKDVPGAATLLKQVPRRFRDNSPFAAALGYRVPEGDDPRTAYRVALLSKHDGSDVLLGVCAADRLVVPGDFPGALQLDHPIAQGVHDLNSDCVMFDDVDGDGEVDVSISWINQRGGCRISTHRSDGQRVGSYLYYGHARFECATKHDDSDTKWLVLRAMYHPPEEHGKYWLAVLLVRANARTTYSLRPLTGATDLGGVSVLLVAIPPIPTALVDKLRVEPGAKGAYEPKYEFERITVWPKGRRTGLRIELRDGREIEVHGMETHQAPSTVLAGLLRKTGTTSELPGLRLLWQ